MSALEKFLQPVEESLIYSRPNYIGHKIRLYWQERLEENSIALVGCPDLRGAEHEKEFSNIKKIREEFYRLTWNDWSFSVYDLGDIIPGESLSDTHFALKEVLTELFEMKVFPIVLGGNMSLNYAVYEAMKIFDIPLNFTAIDSHIRFADIKQEISEENYLPKMILEEPGALFHFSNIGYQSYFVTNQVLATLDTLDFEYFRLGNITRNPENAEPVFRSSDFVGINLNSVEYCDESLAAGNSANGFNSREISALARYVGLSAQVKSAGIYNFLGFSHNKMPEKLVSELLWYLIDGRNQQQYYKNEKEEYIKYIVLHEDKEIVFLKDKYVDKWWLVVNFDNGSVPTTLVPCSEEDYQNTLEGNLPDRYWRTFKRFL
ncbi:MAG: hypothetical protein LBT29_05540 [Flavobacteriaceae bacterium]|nr:hypothetical protein [Flavobacteriaceae bacterium]